MRKNKARERSHEDYHRWGLEFVHIVDEMLLINALHTDVEVSGSSSTKLAMLLEVCHRRVDWEKFSVPDDLEGVKEETQSVYLAIQSALRAASRK